LRTFRQRRRQLEAMLSRADRARDALQWDLAAQLYRDALDHNADIAPIWVQYGHALKESGNLRDPEKLLEAELAYRRAIRLAPSVADHYLQLGHVLKLQGRPQQAEATYLYAFELDPTLEGPLSELSQLGWSSDQIAELGRRHRPLPPSEVAEDVRAVAERLGVDSSMQVGPDQVRSVLPVLVSDPKLADRVLQQLMPDRPEVALELSLGLLDEPRPPVLAFLVAGAPNSGAYTREQLNLLERGCALHPESVELLLECARAEQNLGHGGAAIEMARRAVSVAPDNPLAASELIWFLRWNGKWPEARTTARVAVRRHPGADSLQQHLAAIEFVLEPAGDTAALDKYLARLQTDAPAVLELAKFLVAQRRPAKAFSLLDGYSVKIDGSDLEIDRYALPLELQLLKEPSTILDRTRVDTFLRRLDRAGLPEDDPTQQDAGRLRAHLSWFDQLGEPTRAALFDRSFIAFQLCLPASKDDDHGLRYLLVGSDRLLSPTPFFDPVFYRRSRGTAEGSDPFIDYMTEGWKAERPFHPLFDLDAFCRDTNSSRGELNPLLYTVDHRSAAGWGRAAAAGAARRGGHSFDCIRDVAAAAVCESRQDFEIEGIAWLEPEIAKGGDALRVLFDVPFYGRQLAERDLQAPPGSFISHFFEEGERSGLSPHPLFRSSFYIHRYAISDRGVSPFLDFVSGGASAGRTSHPLFRHRSKGETGIISVLDYLKSPLDRRPEVTRFFDPDFYRTSNPDVDWTLSDPLLHYLSIGALGRCGSDRAGLSDRGSSRWSDGASPTAAFDPAYYAATQMMDDTGEVSPLEHFNAHAEPRPKTFALFDPAAYLAMHADLQQGNLCPVSHYVATGIWEDRRPAFWRSAVYIRNQNPRMSFAGMPELGHYLAARQNRRMRLLFVGHEATRTGAPGILFKLVEHMATYDGMDCLTILDQGGALEPDFAAVSHTHVSSADRFALWDERISKAEFEANLDRQLALFDDNPPACAILNSAEVRPYADYFAAKGIPVVFLVHEIAEFYPPPEMKALIERSNKVIFPARFVEEAMQRVCPVPDGRSIVLPQGLLRASFGDAPPVPRAELFAGTGARVADDDFVVMGCGTIDGRKGFDLFIAIARLAKERACGRRIRFIWVGGRSGWRMGEGALYDTIGYWASWELRRTDLAEDVVVINEVSNTEPYFQAADLFLVTSRADPFPCVVHEAMACALPILSFDGCTGSPDAYMPGGGAVVPYGDLGAMAQAIAEYCEKPATAAAAGEVNRRRVKQDFRFEDYAERVKEVIAEVARLPDAAFGTRPATPENRGKVFFATPLWSLSGVNTFTESLTNYLNANGFDATIVLTAGRFGMRSPIPSSRAFDTKPEPELLPSAKYRFLQPEDGWVPSRPLAFRRLLEANAPCIMVPNFDYNMSPIALDPPAGVSVLGIAHSDDVEHYEHAYRYGPYWSRIVAVSDRIAEQIKEANPRLAEKLTTIRYGLAPPPAEAFMELLSARKAHAAPVRLIYAGRFEVRQKRIFDYCDLASQLTAAGISYHLTLAGDGTAFETVARRMLPAVQRGQVTLTGHISQAEVTALMRKAHVVLVLSDFEGLPLSLIEGLQNGCIPIVYQMKSGIPEVLSDGENGFIVPSGDLPAVVERIRWIQTDPTLRVRLIDAALATSDAKGLTLDAMGRRYAELFEDVLSEMRATP
jgi:glycosyltransferase involved in cell wall biosynthesis/tetratricopeptide (TPR) repeat protein